LVGDGGNVGHDDVGTFLEDFRDGGVVRDLYPETLILFQSDGRIFGEDILP
jgi:hypothetical protein